MKSTRSLTISAMLSALGVLLVYLGSILELFDIALVMLASFLVLFVMIELRARYACLVYAVTSLASFLLIGGQVVFLYLLFGGPYPILKHYIEKLPRAVAMPVKLLFFNPAAIGLFFISTKIFGLAIGYPAGLLIAILALANVVFVIYDFLLTRLVGYYFARLRPRIRRFLD